MLKANFSYVCWDVVNSLSVITAGWQASFSSSICCSRADAEADSRCIQLKNLYIVGFVHTKCLHSSKGFRHFSHFLSHRREIDLCEPCSSWWCTYKSQHTHTAGILAQVFFSRSSFKYFWEWWHILTALCLTERYAILSRCLIMNLNKGSIWNIVIYVTIISVTSEIIKAAVIRQ